MKHLILAIAVFAVASAANAEEKSWACNYSDKGVQVEFNKNGNPAIELGRAGMDPVVLVFDTDTGKARLIANSTVEVIPVLAGGTLSFIEKTPSGLSVITLYLSSPIGSSERVPFAQARHLDLAGPFPQQYYGTCTPIGG